MVLPLCLPVDVRAAQRSSRPFGSARCARARGARGEVLAPTAAPEHHPEEHRRQRSFVSGSGQAQDMHEAVRLWTIGHTIDTHTLTQRSPRTRPTGAVPVPVGLCMRSSEHIFG